MKIIKCDVCGKQLDLEQTHIIGDFMEPSKNVDLCGKCLDVYRGMESSFLIERGNIRKKYEGALDELKNQYKEKILKLRKNS